MATITNNTFNGVVFDESAVSAIESIANGLIQNAKGLTALAEVFKASNINMEAMIKVETLPLVVCDEETPCTPE